jgi:hypothetical protein
MDLAAFVAEPADLWRCIALEQARRGIVLRAGIDSGISIFSAGRLAFDVKQAFSQRTRLIRRNVERSHRLFWLERTRFFGRREGCPRIADDDRRKTVDGLKSEIVVGATVGQGQLGREMRIAEMGCARPISPVCSRQWDRDG